MQHNFICFKRFHGKGIEGEFNIKYKTTLLTDDKFIYYNGDCNTGKTVCAIESDTSYRHFAINDDGKGLERGNLTSSIINLLVKEYRYPPNPLEPPEVIPKDNVQGRWNKLWEDEFSNQFRRQDYPDRWFWGTKFYQARIEDLEHILSLIKEVK